MQRRTLVKWLHWVCAFLVLWFFIFEPESNRTAPGEALSTHAGMGVILGVATAIWFAMYLLKGALGRPGPKLPELGKKIHVWKHKILYFGLPLMVLSGALAGLLAPFAIYAFDLFAINLASGTKALHNIAEEIHEIVFNALIVIVVAHTVFHLWRHYFLKDNALRLILPKVLHRYF